MRVVDLKKNQSKKRKRFSKRLEKFLKNIKKQKSEKVHKKNQIIERNCSYHKSLILYISVAFYIVFIVSVYLYYN